jgi:phosphopantothenoylcysteine decarboxylase/phosphopantothenate--cysteine ligase
MKQKMRLNILISAGPTRQPIDPVRFISNYSTGLLGYEIAREAKQRGHRVILISGPTALLKPPGVHTIDVLTARQMQQQLENKFAWCDCLIMTAAVCDFRPKAVLKKKIKRSRRKELVLRLAQSPDILGSLSRGYNRRIRQDKLLVGFALETEQLRKNAQGKLRQKDLDLIVATQMKPNSYPFGQARMDALIINNQGRRQQFRQATKARLSRILLDTIEKIVL